MGVRRGMCSLTDLAICGFSDPTFVLCCVPEAFPEIMGVAGANMQWGHFVNPSSSEEGEHLFNPTKRLETFESR